MPGGSVNGRPFRETADSYSRTGIPCGNPRRYQSREVMKMGVQNQTALSRPLTGPLEDIETEGERQLQTLLHKQLNTNITLKGHFSQHKRFSEAVSHKAATDILSGTFTLDQYQHESQLDQYVVELKHCGLTEDEIQLKLEDMGMSPSKKKKLRLNLEPGIRDKKMETINSKISAKKKELEKIELFSGARAMGRHEMDLEKSISHNNNRTKLLNCLLTTTSSDSELRGSEDPMDHLQEILTEMSKREKKTKNNRKHQQPLPQDKSTEVTGENHDCDTSRVESDKNHDTPIQFPKPYSDRVLDQSVPSHSGLNQTNITLSKTKRDIHEDCPGLRENKKVLSENDPVTFESSESVNNDSLSVSPKLPSSHQPPVQEDSTVHEPPVQEDSTVHEPPVKKDSTTHEPPVTEDSTPRILSSKVVEIPLDDILANRLSVEEIKELPRFQNYHPGQPSKVLYVKNLPMKVKDEDLVSLFIRFQKNSQIIFRLLTGRMRGQAFITFNDEETATEALKLLNGHIFKTKPIIIQFGKKQNSHS